MEAVPGHRLTAYAIPFGHRRLSWLETEDMAGDNMAEDPPSPGATPTVTRRALRIAGAASTGGVATAAALVGFDESLGLGGESAIVDRFVSVVLSMLVTYIPWAIHHGAAGASRGA